MVVTCLTKRTVQLSKKVIIIQCRCLIVDVVDRKLELLDFFEIVINLKCMHKLRVETVFYVFRATDLQKSSVGTKLSKSLPSNVILNFYNATS